MKRDENRRYALKLVAGWSCDEVDRAECRNRHGCHCREITAMLESKDRGATVTNLKAIEEINRLWPLQEVSTSLPKGEL